MKIECSVEELKELLNIKETPVAGTTDVSEPKYFQEKHLQFGQQI